MDKHTDIVVASTKCDSYGEIKTKEFFEKLIENCPRIPVGQQHDMSLPTVGFIENFRIIEDSTCPGEWNVIADVFLISGDLDSALKGMSYTFTEKTHGRIQDSEFSVYLPHPFYNDEEFIQKYVTLYPDAAIGRVYRKSADPILLAIIIGATQVVIGPVLVMTTQKLTTVITEKLTTLGIGSSVDRSRSV